MEKISEPQVISTTTCCICGCTDAPPYTMRMMKRKSHIGNKFYTDIEGPFCKNCYEKLFKKKE